MKGVRLMIFDCRKACCVAACQDWEGEDPFTLPQPGLWVGILSGGRCTIQTDPTPDGTAGSAPAAGGDGDLLLGAGPLLVRPLERCHLYCIQLQGLVPQAFLQGLPSARFVKTADCHAAAELLNRLDATLPATESSRLAYELLCLLGAADEPANPLPPLVAQALEAIHSGYMTLYGVEELSEQLAVSKCHLVRTFTAAVGISPGRYLTKMRIEAAKSLLLAGNHNLEAVAALCGFSGANYLCRVFKRETGLSPAAWRAGNTEAARRFPSLAATQQDEIYV